MGYTTSFEGSFRVDPPLAEHHRAYLQKFSHVRHMRRDASITATMPDPLRVAVGLPIGDDAIYYVGSEAPHGQDDSDRTLGLKDFNWEPRGAPGLWCNWTPNHDGSAIEWDEGEKFYSYVEWMQFIIDRFLGPWGYVLSGQVEYQGERNDDMGIISIKNGKAIRTQGKTNE